MYIRTTLSLLVEKILHNYEHTHRQRWYFCVTHILLSFVWEFIREWNRMIIREWKVMKCI